MWQTAQKRWESAEHKQIMAFFAYLKTPEGWAALQRTPTTGRIVNILPEHVGKTWRPTTKEVKTDGSQISG